MCAEGPKNHDSLGAVLERTHEATKQKDLSLDSENNMRVATIKHKYMMP